MANFVVCVPAGAGVSSVAPCADVAGAAYVPAVVEYAEPGAVTFDNANVLFAYGFTGVLTVWLLGLAIGAIMSLISKDW